MLQARACKWRGCAVDVGVRCRLHPPSFKATSPGCCASTAWRTSTRRGPRTACSPSTSRCLVRRAGAPDLHTGMPHENPDRVLCVGALGALICTVQRPTFSQARAASLTPLVVRAGERIALEADGPSHFNANTLAPGGPMLARHRLLAARGWAVISVPYYVWNELKDDGRGAWLMQARLLRSLLPAA